MAYRQRRIIERKTLGHPGTLKPKEGLPSSAGGAAVRFEWRLWVW